MSETGAPLGVTLWGSLNVCFCARSMTKAYMSRCKQESPLRVLLKETKCLKIKGEPKLAQKAKKVYAQSHASNTRNASDLARANRAFQKYTTNSI